MQWPAIPLSAHEPWLPGRILIPSALMAARIGIFVDDSDHDRHE